MSAYTGELNSGMVSLHEALRSEPMVAAKVRLSIIGFSDDVAVRMTLADLRTEERLPRLQMEAGRTTRPPSRI